MLEEARRSGVVDLPGPKRILDPCLRGVGFNGSSRGSREGIYLSAARLAPALRPVDGALYAPLSGQQQRSRLVSINRVRAIVLGFLALLAVGSFGATAASANPGPFWHHRNSSAEKNGLKIDQPNDENFSGEGGEQKLLGKINGTEFEIVAKSVQAKGVIYNNSLQGQIKVTLLYHEPKLVVPVLKECQVKIGINKNNEVKAEGHLAWKWNGTKAQLEEQPQANQKPGIIFTPKEITSGEKKLPEGIFTEITLSPSKACGVLAGTFKVTGNLSTITKPGNLEEWSTTLVTEFPGWTQQHFWNGNEFIGAEPKLVFNGSTSTLTGSVTSKSAVQEIAVFEK